MKKIITSTMARVFCLAAACLALFAGRSAADPVAGVVTPFNYVSGSYVSNGFNLNTNFTDSSGTITNCQYTLNGSNWNAATMISSGTTGACRALGIACADAQSLALNMQATDSNNLTGAGASVSKICDAQAPTTANNAPASWQASNVTVTLTATDSESGVQTLGYCTDASNSCTPNSYTGNPGSVSITCSAGNVCQTYLRYQARDNVLNLEAVKSVLVKIDEQAPTGGSISYPNGVTGSPISVSLANGTDGSGSGIGTTLLQRAQAALTGNTCGGFGAFSTIATNPGSPYSDSVGAKTCNMYQYVVSDQVGNRSTYTSPNVARVK